MDPSRSSKKPFASEPLTPQPPAPDDASPPSPDEKREPRRHDQTYKHVFSFSVAQQDLLGGFGALGWLDEGGVSSVRGLPTESVGRDLQRRLCDCALWVRFKNGRSGVLQFEFQSSNDAGMVLRTMRYAEAALSLFYGNKTLRDPGGAMPLVLSHVLYTGAAPWSAASTLEELAAHDALPPDLAQAARDRGTAHGHAVLDLRRAWEQGKLPEDGVLGWLAALEVDWWQNFERVRQSIAERWGEPEHREAREALAAWLSERVRVEGVPKEDRNVIKHLIVNPKEEVKMSQSYQEWAEGHRQKGVAQGLERGRAEGRAELLVRLASRRFGARTAKRLERLVRTMDAEDLARVGDAVVDSATGDELLETATNGETDAEATAT